MAPKQDSAPGLTASIRQIAGPQRARYLAAAAGGHPVQITNRGQQYVTMVATADWRRAEQDRAIVRALLQLARTDATPAHYAGLAQMLRDLVDADVLLDETEEVPAMAV